MARSSLYSVRAVPKSCRVVIRARDTDAKQVLFGWAGDRGAAVELYGRNVSGRGDLWEWKLSPPAIRELQKGIVAQVTQRSRYGASKRENAAAAQLSRKLRKAAARFPAKCALDFKGYSKRRG